MEQDLQHYLGKTCVIGLSYFDTKEEQLDQKMLGGEVVKVDKENGITIKLAGNDEQAEFILPSDLSCWFIAPKGEFHTSIPNVKISNPDYLVTWDIYQTRNDKGDGEQQWWEWVPRTEPPHVNN